MLYNATKSEKYALRVTVQHRRVSMNDNEKKELTEKLASIDYEYDAGLNQFV